MGVGRGTHTRVKILALSGIIFMSKQWRIKDTQIVGDSQVLINWAKGLTNLQPLSLTP